MNYCSQCGDQERSERPDSSQASAFRRLQQRNERLCCAPMDTGEIDDVRVDIEALATTLVPEGEEPDGRVPL